MKKVNKSSKKGFTLVELIVVLVILAILAAMLVPALTGYIRRARAEKDYQTASVVQAAAQAAITQMYGDQGEAAMTGTFAQNTTFTANGTTTNYGALVYSLAGVQQGANAGAGGKVGNFSFTYDIAGNTPTYVIYNGWVEVNGATYTLENGAWTGAEGAHTGS
jgi:type IV pilus assembly protein PilA